MTKGTIISLALALSLGGCGAMTSTVHTVARYERGGVLTLHGPLVPATSDAHLLMTAHCGGRWRVLGGHGEVATATDAPLGGDTATLVSLQRDPDREIAYRCERASTARR